jgi:hypothetical protein
VYICEYVCALLESMLDKMRKKKVSQFLYHHTGMLLKSFNFLNFFKVMAVFGGSEVGFKFV